MVAPSSGRAPLTCSPPLLPTSTACALAGRCWSWVPPAARGEVTAGRSDASAEVLQDCHEQVLVGCTAVAVALN